jgi:hypothetical protein
MKRISSRRQRQELLRKLWTALTPIFWFSLIWATTHTTEQGTRSLEEATHRVPAVLDAASSKISNQSYYHFSNEGESS